jgi:hypothetical protein
VPQETVPVVINAFEQLHQGLVHMQSSLADDDLESAMEGAGHVEAASAVIRQARDAYQASLAEQGQTPFPFLNRVLLQVQYLFNDGTETRFVVAALREMPDFLEKIRRDIEVQEERVSHDEARATAEAAAVEVEHVCDGFYHAVNQWHQATERQKKQILQEVYDRLKGAADQLSSALSAFVETDLSMGPTPILVVNLTIRSFENWQAGLIGPDDFHRVLNQAQSALRDMASQMSAAHAQAAADQLELVLARMEEGLVAHGVDGVVGLLPSLKQAAHELALQANSGGLALDDEEEVMDFVDAGGGSRRGLGLPANLQKVIDVAQSYLHGQVHEEDLERALDQLDRAVQGTFNKANNMPGAETLMAPLKEGLTLLQEATQSLRTLPQTPDRRVLDAARSLMTQASEMLLDVKEMPVQ